MPATEKIKVFIGEHLRQARLKKNLKINQLAWATGIDQSAICRFESEERIPTLQQAMVLCRELDVSLDDLCRWTSIQRSKSNWKTVNLADIYNPRSEINKKTMRKRYGIPTFDADGNVISVTPDT